MNIIYSSHEGTQDTQPLSVDTTSSAYSVYLRKNIRRAIKEDSMGNQTPVWEYDEAVLSKEDYLKYREDMVLEALGVQEEAISNISKIAALSALNTLGVSVSEKAQSEATTILAKIAGLTSPPSGEEWVDSVYYPVGVEVTFKGETYTCKQAHVSMVDWTPVNRGNLWKKVKRYPNWDSTKVYNKSDMVFHLGKVWKSKSDNNRSEPSVDENWNEFRQSE